MVPTFTCGLDRSNFSLAMSQEPRALVLSYVRIFLIASIHPRPCVSGQVTFGADDQNRTGDLVLTKDALCQLSYIGLRAARYGRQVGLVITSLPLVFRATAGLPTIADVLFACRRRLERETGIEPATNSLEGCD